jgi:hypothetical protein
MRSRWRDGSTNGTKAQLVVAYREIIWELTNRDEASTLGLVVPV